MLKTQYIFICNVYRLILPDRDKYIFTLLTLVCFIVIYFKGLNSNLDKFENFDEMLSSIPLFILIYQILFQYEE